MADKFPKHWTSVLLREIIGYVIGGDWGKDYSEKYSDEYKPVYIIRGTELKNWKYAKGNTAVKRLVSIDSIAKRQLKEGDLIIEISGGGPDQPVGRTIAIDNSILTSFDAPLICTNFFRLIRLPQSIDPKFINYQLVFYYSKGMFDEYQTNTTNLRNLSFSKLSDELKILIAPSQEQKRISLLLNKLFENLNTIQSRIDNFPKFISSFRQQVLGQAVTGQLTKDWRSRDTNSTSKRIIKRLTTSFSLYKIPNVWEWKTINEIGDVKGGKRLPSGHNLVDYTTAHPYLKAGDLKNGTVIDDKIQYILPKTYAKIKNYVISKDDVYITIVGAKIGDTGTIPSKYNNANLTENAAKITNLHDMNKDYLSIWLRSPQCQYFIKESIMSAAQGKLALIRIKQLPIPIPSKLEQKEIVKRVNNLFNQIDKVEKKYHSTKKMVDELPQLILANAFRGKLVPQNPKDVPVEKLLERIKEEKAKLLEQRTDLKKERFSKRVKKTI